MLDVAEIVAAGLERDAGWSGRPAAPPLPDFIARELPFARSLVDAGGLAPPRHGGGGGAGRSSSCTATRPGASSGGRSRRRSPRAPLRARHARPRRPRPLREAARPRASTPSRTTPASWARSSTPSRPGRSSSSLHDWGGPIGLAALADRPGRLAGLVVTNTRRRAAAPGGPADPLPPLREPAPSLSDVAFRLLGFPQNALHLAQADRRSISGDVARAYRWPLRRLARPRRAARARADGRRSGRTTRRIPRAAARARGRDRRSTGPAAIVWGERDPVLGRALRGVAEALPRATVTRVVAGPLPAGGDARPDRRRHPRRRAARGLV